MGRWGRAGQAQGKAARRRESKPLQSQRATQFSSRSAGEKLFQSKPGRAKKSNPLSCCFFPRCWRSQAATARAILREQGELVRQVDNYSSPPGKVCEVESPCCRFGAGSRGGAVGDAVCAKAESLFFSCQMSAMFRVLRALRKQKSVMRVCCFDACCPANLGTVRFLFGLVRFGLWFVSGFLAVLKTGSVNRFPVRFSTFLVCMYVMHVCMYVMYVCMYVCM